MPRAIALLDCNNFYVSCERVFDARLQKRPVVVLSANDGCVISRSDEARELPIPMGAPLFKFEELLNVNDATIFSANFELYGDMSARVMESLQEFTPNVEIYSVDEAFLQLESDDKKTFTELGFDIRKKIARWTGVPTSIGIAETKTLAKLANKLARNSKKADGVLDLYRSPYLDAALERTPIEKLWGVGANYARTLKQNRIENARQLRDADLRWARKTLSVVGARIVMELRGIKCFPLDVHPPPRRSLTCSRSFGQTVTELKHLREAIAVFLSLAAEKLRRHRLAAHAVTVFVSTDRFNPQPDFYSNAATHSSAFPTDANQELQVWAFACLQKIFQSGFEYRKAGVILSGLIPAEKLTARMYDDERWERFRRVMGAVDEINRKWGRNTVRFAVAKPDGIWRGRADRLSPKYTTRFGEILCVR
jgi:DNA polymerase V